MFYNNTPSDVNNFREIIQKAVAALKPFNIDTIVCRGFSGAVVAPVVAYELGVNWALVRKERDSTHSPRLIEGSVDGKYIILDDFISTGETVNKIIWDVAHYHPHAECLGVYLYDESWLRNWNDDNSRTIILNSIHGLPVLNWNAVEISFDIY